MNLTASGDRFSSSSSATHSIDVTTERFAESSADNQAHSAETSKQRQEQKLLREHPEDDDVLSSIRTVRRMVEREFMEADQRWKRRTKKRTNGRTSPPPNKTLHGDRITEDVPEDHDGHFEESWKNQCFRLKQELYEEKKRSGAMSAKHKDDLAKASSKLEEAITEAALDRDAKVVLIETLDAQRKLSDRVAFQLSESVKNSERFRILWKDLVRSAEDEKESMNREREASAELLEETKARLLVSLEEHEQFRRKASDRNEELSRRIEELERIHHQQHQELDVPSASLVTNKQQQQVPSPFWDQSKTRTILKQKLRKLEDSLAKDAETIRLLEQQIVATTTATTANANETTTKPSQSKKSAGDLPMLSVSATKKHQLNQKKERLRTNSVGVLGEVIVLQLQRLMEIHIQTTKTATAAIPKVQANTAGKSDEKSRGFDSYYHDDENEWTSILQNLSRNHVRILELRKDDAIGANGANSPFTQEATTVVEKLNSWESCSRDGGSCDDDPPSSPTKRLKTKP